MCPRGRLGRGRARSPPVGPGRRRARVLDPVSDRRGQRAWRSSAPRTLIQMNRHSGHHYVVRRQEWRLGDSDGHPLTARGGPGARPTRRKGHRAPVRGAPRVDARARGARCPSPTRTGTPRSSAGRLAGPSIRAHSNAECYMQSVRAGVGPRATEGVLVRAQTTRGAFSAPRQSRTRARARRTVST